MTNKKILIIASFAALVCAGELDDVEQKKRASGKTTTLNAIPTGGQKPEYTYSIYSQNPAASQTIQQASSYSQFPNSFYPSQSGSNQYYQASNIHQDPPSVYSQQPQLNLIPPPQTSSFVPLNFLPSAGYQAKYQIVPPKTPNSNFQLALLQPSLLQSPQIGQYQHALFNPSNQIGIQQPISYSPQGQFAQNYQLPIGAPYQLGHPSTMLLFAQPNPSLYNNLLYPNPSQNLYNYYQPSPQPKYNVYYGASSASQPLPSNDYDKLHGPIQQNVHQKEDNEIGSQTSDYLTPAESNANYKNTYVTSRTSYKN